MAKFCTECANPINDNGMPFCPKCGAKLPIVSPEIQPAVARPTTSPQPTQPMVCKSCGNPIKVGDIFCSKCLIRVPENVRIAPTAAQSQNSTTESTTKKRSIGEWIAIVCGGVILLVVVAAFIAGMSSGISGASKTTSASNNNRLTIAAPTPTIDPIVQIKSQAQTIPYVSLMRTPDNYKNTAVYFKGKIVQIQNQFGDNYILRIATKQNSYIGYSDDVVYVNFKGIPQYNGNRILEDDMVDLWGTFVGIKTYSALLGNDVTIPEMNALRIELIGVEDTTSNSAITNPKSSVSNQDGTISINTYPSGAQIFINGQYAGNSPFDVKKTPGTYQIEIKESGYIFETVNIQVNGGKTTGVYNSLNRAPIRQS